MKISITLDENPTPGQITKGLQVMLMLSGTAVMSAAVQALHETFNDDDEAETVVAAAPPPPPNTPPPPVGAPSADRDSSGLPWDARIHSSKKTTNKDGTWKARKNIDAAEILAVTNELRALTGQPAAAPPPPPTVAPVVAVPPPPTTAAAPPPPAAGGPVTDFVGIMKKITEGLSTGKLDQAKVSAALASVGLKQPLDLNGNPAQIPGVAAYLDAVMI